MSMHAVGLMSGTSTDGIDAALVRFDGNRPDVTLVAFVSVPYRPDQRERLLAVVEHGTVQECALVDAELGGAFADAARAVLRQAGAAAADLAFVASHGHTVWHAPGRASFQLGNPAQIAERLGTTVVSDFRSRDVAAGGQGAPLVPVADARLFSDPDGPRVLLNIGGIANVSWVPPAGGGDAIVAFDTGPGVAVSDAVVRRLVADAVYDQDGRLASHGLVVESVVEECLADRYFATPPPKSTGRERFGGAYADALLERIRAAAPEATAADMVATATALTARSIADQIHRWLPSDGADVIVSGGGARNSTLLASLRAALPRTLALFSDLYFDGDAKEAVAFALLGWLTLRSEPGNVPTATGAAGPRVLGRITPP